MQAVLLSPSLISLKLYPSRFHHFYLLTENKLYNPHRRLIGLKKVFVSFPVFLYLLIGATEFPSSLHTCFCVKEGQIAFISVNLNKHNILLI